MSKHREWDPTCKVYIGNLKSNANKYEIEDLFTKYGPLKNIWIARNPPGFAFIEYEDPRDAEDAVRGLDGTRCCGSRIIVQMSTGKRSRDKSPVHRLFIIDTTLLNSSSSSLLHPLLPSPFNTVLPT